MKIRDLISILKSINELNSKLNYNNIFWDIINGPVINFSNKEELQIKKAKEIDAAKKFREHINNLSDNDILDIGYILDNLEISSYAFQELEMKISIKELLLREE